jgi:hypothetical protein
MDPNPPPTAPLGPVVRTFRPTRVNLVAGGVLGLLLLGGGGVFIARAPLQEPKAVTFVYVMGAACVTGGLLLLAFTVRLARTRVDLCAGGFRYHSLHGVDEVTWDEVDLIQHNVAAKKGEGTKDDPSITVLTEEGKTYHFTANHVTKMTAFVKTLGELTSGYDNLWEVTSKASKRRLAIVLIVAGLFLMVVAPVTFLDIARAEQNAGGEPVRVHTVVFLLYQVGGKWLAAAGMFLLGLGFAVWGLVANRRATAYTPKRRKTKRTEHATTTEAP